MFECAGRKPLGVKIKWRPQCRPVGTGLFPGCANSGFGGPREGLPGRFKTRRVAGWALSYPSSRRGVSFWTGCADTGDSRMPSTPQSIADAFRTTLDLFETGLDLMRQNLRRTHPEAAEEVVGRLLREWLRVRPGAESGDCPGRTVDVSTRQA